VQILWALARLGVTPPLAWISLLEAGMTHSVRDLWRSESALLLWGLGQMDYRPKPGFVDAVLSQVRRLQEKVKHQAELEAALDGVSLLFICNLDEMKMCSN
jgi:hypothetical protein